MGPEAGERWSAGWRWGAWGVFSALLVYALDFHDPDKHLLNEITYKTRALGLPLGTFTKVLHVLVFAAWTYLLANALGRPPHGELSARARWILAGMVVLTAGGTELLQQLNPARHPAWADAGFDLLGAGLGLAARALRRRPRRTAPGPGA
ncbi:MAG: hypothetical protein M5U26_17300 [Planctomycetota bacterium]|nr:hypothetical protein [Planctomycetota bacterium]